MGQTEGQTPRAFISHGSEDKGRFVLAFARALLDAGIDAWVDQWEMKPGDSLVQRIFDEGIGLADAFVVVLSATSVVKPWVREELDAGVVRRINTGRATQLIPVILDEGVDVPVPLQHLLWASVPKDGFNGVVQQVVDQLHGSSRKPALGVPPPYTKTQIQWTTNAADETIFRLIVAEVTEHDGPGWVLYSNGIEDQAGTAGIATDQFVESMHALIKSGLIKANPMAGGRRFRLHPLPDDVWLRIQRAAGLDIDEQRRRVLAAIVNENNTRFRPVDFTLSFNTLGAILRSLKNEGILTFNLTANGDFLVRSISPLAKRMLNG